jgi:ribosomal-protein-serine acetyltransferase
VLLRTLREEDAAELFLLVDANREHLRRWLPWVDSSITVEDSLAFIRRDAGNDLAGKGFSLAVEVRGRIVGVAGFNRIDAVDRKAEIGYWLSRDAQGRGTMTMCCRALVGLAFGALDLNRVEIHVATGNDRSRAIPVRLGFSLEGVIREAALRSGVFEDHAVYGLLRREWRG